MDMLAIRESIARSRVLVAKATERVRLAQRSEAATTELLRAACAALARSHELLARKVLDVQAPPRTPAPTGPSRLGSG